MTGCTLPVWLIILLIECVLLFVIGGVNYYVPKDQRLKVKTLNNRKDESRRFVFSFHRFNPDYYIYLGSTMLILVVTVFFLTSFADFIQDFDNGYLEVTLVLVFSLVGIILTILLFVALLFLGEKFAELLIRKYYGKRYNFKVFFVEYLE